ncbi:unnamed protein product [Phaedon cochleariae]|uniref:Arf-GAP domain-containing protein n=1 Tax=Phaedon cochleariae TaxID=80249 RepID=A0A9N9SC93_PHACE|nr:unnamed protein product [Phaedon cochleariae]
MSLKPEKDKVKQLQDKCQSVLNSLLRDEDNKYCVDCDSKGPRWASWNIGVFLCIRCAGIHRNLGVHISKVKSVNLDSWTPEQVVSLQQMGNSRARAVYEANLPDNFRRPQSDSSLETFIRAKYEHKKYIAREWVPPTMPKVNWEKEIDDEIEKQKRKKKTIVEKKSLSSVEVPQLPKPTNPSPKPARSTNGTLDTSNKEKKDKKDSDLLGFQNGDDSFSGFVSAPTTVDPKPEKLEPQPDLAKNEEESFFNQVIPAEKEKVKLDKNGILALYANGPSNNFNQFPQVTYPAAQPPFQAFAPFQQQAQPQPPFAPIQTGIGQLPNHWPQQQWGKQAQIAGAPAQGQLQFNMTGAPQVPTQFNANPAMGGFPPPAAPAQFYQPPFAAGGPDRQPPNPFFAAQNLQQQFGALNLDNRPANAGNAWP